MFQGSLVFLKEIDKGDFPEIIKWRNDPEILQWLFSYLPLSTTKQEIWYNKYVEDESTLGFIIKTCINTKSIGTITLTGIDYKNQKAELGILIGEKEYRHRGYATEAVQLVLSFAFQEMNLHKICLNVLWDNRRAIKLYEKLGFRREGILRQEVYKRGRFNDVLVMGLLKEEFAITGNGRQ